MGKLKYLSIVLALGAALFVFLFLFSKNAEKEYGVAVESARLVALGRIVDVRVRVLDPTKAEPIFSKNNKPYLVDSKTGRRFGIASSTKVGPMRSTNVPKEQRTYPFEFMNMSMNLKPGDEVTLVIGDLQKKGIILE